MRRVVGAAVALLCVVLLSSCSLLPTLPLVGRSPNPEYESNVELRHIADAVKHHDAAALEKLFSPAARKRAPDLDAGVKHFLSVFPSGKMKTLDLVGCASTGDYNKGAEAIYPQYVVSEDGQKYDLFFAWFSVNSFDPDNVGIWALGITPHTADRFTASGAPKPFYAWSGAFDNGSFTDPGTPGVYVRQK